MTLPAGLELVPLADDTAQLVDRRIGFAIAIPGQPELLPPAATQGVSEPTYEALVRLADIPVSLRYRHNEMPSDSPNTQRLVEAYAANRCPREELRRAQPAAEAQCRAWGVKSAASAIYPLREPDDAGDDMEEALILFRDAWIVTLTKRFARERLSWVSWALCNSALAAGTRWDPARVEPLPALWPASTFLLPGVKGIVVAARAAAAHRLAEVVRGETDRLADRLARLLQGSDAPVHAIAPEERTAYEQYLADACDRAATRQALGELLAEVKTAHDLRGLAIIGLHALGKYRATFASDHEQAAHAFEHLAE